MKPTWGIRKLNEYSVDKNTAIIITDSEKDNYYWADIPDGSLLVNDKTGNLSIKLTGESDWVPMGIRKDGTEKLVKDAIINVEYYTIVKFELEHNRFYYHDREEITRIGKLINGKAQFKVGSGLYLPGTNQLEVLINDSVHRNTVDGGLEEINMKYFQIDADDIRLGSTVTVRYINYERLSELYPFIYTQEQVPWFFEDKDLWINPSDNVDVNGLTITPLSYYVKYLDNNEAEVIVFTTKNSRLIASRKMSEYVNKITDKNINRFKVTRENNNFYINLFSTYPGYKTSFAKVLIKGLISDEDKLTLDVDLTYPNSGMAKTSIKTQLGNIVTIKRNNKKIYAAQNIGIGVQHTLAREDHDYDIIVYVKNPTNGLTKEKVLTIKKKMIHLTANIDHITTSSGTTVTVETIPGSKINIAGIDPASGGVIAQDVIVDDTGRYTVTIPLAQNEETYNVIVSNDKADNRVTEIIHISLHSPRTPLSVYVVDGHDGLNDDYEGTKALSIQAESGSTIIIKNASGNVVNTRTPSNLSIEEILYRIPFFYYPETKTFTVEAVKTNKVPESKTVTVEGYKKVNATTPFNVNAVSLNNRIWDVSFDYIKGSTITAYDANNNIIKTKDNKDNFVATSDETMRYFAGRYYSFKQKNNDYTVRFTCTHPLYNDQEVTRTIEGAHLPDHQIELLNTYVINPYADMYNSDAYQVLELKLYKTTDDLDRVHLTLDTHPEIQNNLTLSYGGTNAKPIQYLGSNLLDKINGSKTSYLEFYGKDDLSNEETLTILPKINDYLSNAYEGNNGSYYFIFKVDNFYDLMENRNINIKVNNKVTNDINIPTAILHWKNFDKSINKDSSIENKINTKYNVFHKVVYSASANVSDNCYSVNKNIKYIHPNFIKFINIRYEKRYFKNKYDALISKLKEKKYLDNNYRNSKYYSYDEIIVDGEIFDTRFKYLDFSSDLILFPLRFSYLFASISIDDSNYIINDDGTSPMLYLNCNVNNENIIGVKINNSDFIKEFYKSIDEIGIRKNSDTYGKLLEQVSSSNLIFEFSGKTIPSFLLGDYNHRALKNGVIANNVERVLENGFVFLNNSYVLIDYTKLKELNNFAFSNYFIGYNGPRVKNIGPNDTITIKLKDEEYVDNGARYKLADLNSDMNYSVFDKIYPFPSYESVSDYFDLKIKCGNNHLKISDLLFNNSAIKSFDIESPSITFIDEFGEVISYKNIPSTPRILGMNRKFNTVKDRYNIPDGVSIINSNYMMGHFANTRLKEIDLRKFTNYFLQAREFAGNNELIKVIFPDKYISHNYNETINGQYALWNCYAIEIENLGFITSASNTAGYNSFYETKKLQTPINMNYFNYIEYSAFGNSNASDFIYEKRTVTTDYYGEEVVIDDGYLESIEKGNKFPVKMKDKAFYETNMSQESFNRIKDNFVNFVHECFCRAKNIKEVVLNNSNLLSFSEAFLDVPLEKFVINSNSVKSIILSDRFLKNQKLNDDPDNYKINAINNEIFMFDNFGAYSTIHTINMPNLKHSYIAKPGTRIDFGYNYLRYEEPLVLARHLDDFGGSTSGIDISYFNDQDSITNANLETLEINDWNTFYALFSNVVNKNDIKIKKLVIKMSNRMQPQDIREFLTYSPTSNMMSLLESKEYIQKYRWPALEEINIKNDFSNPTERTVLGVKIKYV